MSDWSEANQLYAQGKFKDALDKYLSAPADNSAFYFNVGITNLKLGSPGAAFAYLSRAQLLGGSDKELNRALDAAKRQLIAQVGESGIDQASGFFEKCDELIGLPNLAIASFVFSIVFGALSLFAWIKQKDRGASKNFLITSSCALLLAISIAAIGPMGGVRPLLIAYQDIQAKTGPGDKYQALLTIHAGTKLRLEDRPADFPDWLQVRVTSDSVAWIKDGANSGVLRLGGTSINDQK